MAEPTESPESARDALLQRQRQEIKDLRAKIESMKKSVPKGDKRRKKEVTAETAQLEKELKEKHEQEMTSFEASDVGSMLGEVVGVGGGGGGGGGGEEEESWKVADEDRPTKKSRAQKRKEKKALQEVERQREREEEEREMALVDNPRLRERENLESLLGTLQLTVIDVQPDGNCLYAAISDQLQRRLKIESSVAHLRAQCAEYVRSHRNDFMPFATDPKTGSLLTSDQFAQYCLDIESTASWGGQLEIRALSHVYQVTITVYQAESPPVVVGEEFSNLPTSLTLSYHRHEYGLGEHYNSLAPVTR